MLNYKLAPYIVVSILLHTGLLFSVQSFLRLPDTHVESPLLIPVEITVLRVTTSKLTARKPQDSTVLNQMAGEMDGGQSSQDIADPSPVETDYSSSVNFVENNTNRMMRMRGRRQGGIRKPEIVLSQPPHRPYTSTNEVSYEVPPSPTQADNTPRFIAGTAPILHVQPKAAKENDSESEALRLSFRETLFPLATSEPLPPTGSAPIGISDSISLVRAKSAGSPIYNPKGDEVVADSVSLVLHEPAEFLAAANPSPPAELTPIDASNTADLAEVNVAVRSYYSQMSHAAFSSLMERETGDDFAIDQRPLPQIVENNPLLPVSALQINSQPEGAQVYVDGLLSGDTPFDMELTHGKHEVRLALPNYYDWKAQIDLTETDRLPPISQRLLPIE